MPISALDDLRAAFAELRDALDGDDINMVDAATGRVRDATARIREAGAWRDEPALRDRLNGLMPLIEAARIRTNVLNDNARQRMHLLGTHGAAQMPLTYGR